MYIKTLRLNAKNPSWKRFSSKKNDPDITITAAYIYNVPS